MFDIFRLKEVLVKYKETFVSKQWPDEKYKWEAVKCFQDNWDVNAPDFADMLTRSLAKTYNLLASMNNFPAKMIQGFAKVAPEEVRAMYIALFDESKDVVTRILEFKNQSSILLEKYGNGAGQHYQYENAVSTYLWLRYPEKYYIYKYGEVKTVADELGSDYRFKKGAYADNLRNFFALYDEIRAELKKDGGLVNLLKSQITDACYDIDTVTMTIYQPRRSNVSTYTVSTAELLEWAETVLKPTAELAFKGEGEFHCGEWCQFCKAKADCRERAKANLALAAYDFAEPPLLTDEEVEEVLAKVDDLVSWANDIKEYALQAAISGKAWNGWKVVEGRSNRKYTDERLVAAAVIAAGHDPYEQKLLGITEMQKTLGKAKFDELLGRFITKPQGKPTLVPMSDKRPAMNTAASDFEN